MLNKKRLIVFGVFLLALFFMTMYAGGTAQNTSIATRLVKFIDGYNNAEISTQNVEVGKEATKPADPEHINLLFSGWFSGDNRVTDFTNIMENLTVISRYVDDINNNGIADSDETPFRVTFYDTIANSNIRVVEVLPGMNATAPTAPEHNGYTFNGWSTSYRNVTEDRTINTIYISELATVTTHTVRFLVDGEELSSQEIVNGASASEPSETVIPKKEKQVFIGWDKSFDNVTSDLTINAIYADDINENGKADADENKFTIRFETNGNGTFTGETSFTGLLEGLKVYDFIELPEYEANPGYTFIGWDRELPEDDAVITDSFVYTAIFKDITKPEVIVSDIVDGQFNPEKFTFNAKDPNGIVSLSYTIRPKGEKDSVQSGYIKYQDILDDLTKTYSINELPDGEYELRISIRDVAENPNHVSVINFIVDNTNPTLEDVVINKNITNENSIEISGKIFDENIRYTSIRIFNSLNESVLQKTVFENYDGLIENLDISTFDDDTYRVRLKVYDLAGNTEQINKTLVIDRTAPKVEVVIPKPGDFNPEEFTFKTNDENGLEGMNYTIWTKGQADLKQSGGNQYKGAEEIEETYSINELPNGEYELRISIKDLAGNSNHVAPIYFTVDKTAPTVTNIVIDPMINSNTGGEEITVSFDIIDESDIDLNKSKVMFSDGPDLVGRLKSSPQLMPEHISGNSYKVVFTTSTFVSSNYVGNYNLKFTIYDVADNHKSYKPKDFRPILIDNSGPLSNLKEPIAGSEITETTSFIFETTDDTGVASGYVNLVKEGKNNIYNLIKLSENNWYVDIDTTKLEAGEYSVETRFIDVFETARYSKAHGNVIIKEPKVNTLEVANLNYKNDREELAWKTGTSKENPTSTMSIRFRVKADLEIKAVKVFWNNDPKLNFTQLVNLMKTKHQNNDYDDFNDITSTIDDNNYFHAIADNGLEGPWKMGIMAIDVEGNTTFYSGHQMYFDQVGDKPEAIISYNTNSLTSGDVLATINFTEEVQDIGNGWIQDETDLTVYRKEFSENITEKISFESLSGIKGDDLEVKVNNIDKNAPTMNVTHSPIGETTESVVVTVTAEDVGIAGLHEQAYSFDGGATWQKLNTYTIGTNQTLSIKVRDKLENTISQSYTVSNVIPKPHIDLILTEGSGLEYTTHPGLLTLTLKTNSSSDANNETVIEIKYYDINNKNKEELLKTETITIKDNVETIINTYKTGNNGNNDYKAKVKVIYNNGNTQELEFHS